MKKKTPKEHALDIHMNTAAMSLAALLTVFHLQMEVSSHGAPSHEVQGSVQATASHASEGLGNLFEREREIHPSHGNYARGRTVNVTGA